MSLDELLAQRVPPVRPPGSHEPADEHSRPRSRHRTREVPLWLVWLIAGLTVLCCVMAAAVVVLAREVSYRATTGEERHSAFCSYLSALEVTEAHHKVLRPLLPDAQAAYRAQNCP